MSLLKGNKTNKLDTWHFIAIFFVLQGLLSEFIVLNYVFRQFYEALADPEGLNDLEIGAKSDENAQKLLHVVKFADVFVSGLF